jgi:hypothetical protein
MLLGPEPDAHQAWVSLLREAYSSKHPAAIAPPPGGGPGEEPPGGGRHHSPDDGAVRPPKAKRHAGSIVAKLAAASGLGLVLIVLRSTLLLWRSSSGEGPATRQPVEPDFCNSPGNRCDEPGEFAAVACRPGAAARCARWGREEARDAEDATWSAGKPAPHFGRASHGVDACPDPRSWHPFCVFVV